MSSRQGKPTVLVLDANQRSALAVTRSLGRRPGQVRVITADSTPSALAASSRYSSAYLRYPCPVSKPRAFLEFIGEAVRRHGIGFLQPVTEITSRILVENRRQLSDAILPFPDFGTLLAVSDKASLTRQAARLGIPVPKTRHFERLDQWDYQSEKTFPLVIKPALSRIFSGGRWIHTRVRRVGSRADLLSAVASDDYLQSHPFMVQEFIPGHGGGVFALAKEGELLCRFAHERIREKPPEGGVSVLCRSARVDRQLGEYAERLLQANHWDGIAMVEFRIDPAGKPYLMEVNTRFWGSLQLSVDAGLDFPWLLYRAFAEDGVAVQSDYRVGTQLRWYLGDLDHLLLTLKNPQLSMRHKLSKLTDFCRFHRNTRHEIFRLNDPLPAFLELRTYLGQILGVS